MLPAGPRHVGAVLAGSRLPPALPASASSQTRVGLRCLPGAATLLVGVRDTPPGPGARAHTIPTSVCGRVSARPRFSLGWSLTGVYSDLPPSSAFILSPQVHWGCVPFVSSDP